MAGMIRYALIAWKVTLAWRIYMLACGVDGCPSPTAEKPNMPLLAVG